MGCDIYLYSKHKKNGEWHTMDVWKKNDYYYDNPNDEEEWMVHPLYHRRNSSLFTALCGVEDYSDGSPKISEPRGIPDDCCPEYKMLSEKYVHSHSWVTLRELLEFQEANQKTKYSGLISAEAAKALDEKGEPPRSWCQGSSDRTMVRRSWEVEQDVCGHLIEKIKQRTEEFYIIHEWEWHEGNIDREKLMKKCEDILRKEFIKGADMTEQKDCPYYSSNPEYCGCGLYYKDVCTEISDCLYRLGQESRQAEIDKLKRNIAELRLNLVMK